LRNRGEILQACRRLALELQISPDELTATALQNARIDESESQKFEDKQTQAFKRTRFLLPSASYALFDYQRELVNELECLFLSRSRAMVSLPTGSGKTRTALAFCLEQFARTPDIRIDWLAPSHELVLQAVETLKSLWAISPLKTELHCAALDAAHNLSVGITFGTIQLAASRIGRPDSRASILIVDEAHRAAALTFSAVIRNAVKAGTFVVGLTATPGRAQDHETLTLSDLFDGRLIVPKLLGKDPVAELRKRGVLANAKFVDISSNADTGSMMRAFVDAVRKDEIVPGIAFASSIAECYAVAASLSHFGLRAAVVTHEHSVSVRSQRLSALENNRLDWLVNVELLTTGIDIPNLRAVAMLCPIGSVVTFEQVIGRATRGPAVGGSEIAIILDGFNHLRKFGDLSSYSRFLDFTW
jgi:DNA repair protein RadD